MSSGRFEASKYQADNGDIRPIRLQPETKAATINAVANAQPAGALTVGADSVRVTGSTREIGTRARRVYGVWNPGAAPTGYDERTPFYIPILTQSVFNGITNDQTISYLGGTGRVTGRVGEAKR